MFSTYLRLKVHTHASAREVIRALYGRMRPDARFRAHRDARHSIIREMLTHHAAAQSIHKTITEPHHPDCPAIDGFGCKCEDL